MAHFLIYRRLVDWGNVGEKPKHTILVVDDSADSTQALAKLLSQRGYVVRTAGTCADARVAIQSAPVDLLLCDLGLPDGDGCELLKQLRAIHGMEGIAVTGSGDPDDIARCREAGFAAHLLKPIPFDRLTSTIENVLSRRES